MNLRLWIGIGAGVAVLAGIGFLLYWPTFAGLKGADAIEKDTSTSFFKPDASAYADFLAQVVDSKGMVRYEEARGPVRIRLNNYLKQVARATPATFKTDEERLAFYLNAYNALVIHGVLENWPIQSIEDVGPMRRFFRERNYKVAGATVSLHGFESRVIRKYDPRLHFALNCASASCPPLSIEVYAADILDAQLDRATCMFICNETFNRYDSETNTWKLSKIFEWYMDDFGGRDGVIGLLRNYSAVDFPDDVNLEYLPYDWGLNLSQNGNTQNSRLGQ